MVINNENTQGGHWLIADENGNPTYVPNCDLRKARKLGAAPSVTSIDGILDKTGLNIWKMNNAVRTAIHTERAISEDDDTYVKRILRESREVNGEAMRYGTYFHNQAENVLNGEDYDEDEPFVAKFKEWADENVARTVWTEDTLMHPSRLFGGRADALVILKGEETPVLLDYKTQKFAYRSGKCVPHFYDSYVRQLAAYADCIAAGEIRPRIMSVAVNTVAPTAPVTKMWTVAEQADALREFMLVAELWTLIKNHDPRLGVRKPAKATGGGTSVNPEESIAA